MSLKRTSVAFQTRSIVTKYWKRDRDTLFKNEKAHRYCRWTQASRPDSRTTSARPALRSASIRAPFDYPLGVKHPYSTVMCGSVCVARCTEGSRSNFSGLRSRINRPSASTFSSNTWSCRATSTSPCAPERRLAGYGRYTRGYLFAKRDSFREYFRETFGQPAGRCGTSAGRASAAR